MSRGSVRVCANGWEALRADPVPWLLGGEHANLDWRVLVELVGRPPESIAVRRAQGAANACEPLATLFRDLTPDGSWGDGAARWRRYSGTMWRLVAAAALGADPDDARLDAAVRRALFEIGGEGGFTPAAGGEPSPCVTGRLLEMLARFGWGRAPRFEEALAWIDEGAPAVPSGGWACPRVGHQRGASGCLVTAVSVLKAAAALDDGRGARLRRRASGAILDGLRDHGADWSFGAPNLLRTDALEMLAALAAAGTPFDHRLGSALARVQQAQLGDGTWLRLVAVPRSLPLGEWGSGAHRRPSRWVTLEAVKALLAYAVPAGLPRLFPLPPR